MATETKSPDAIISSSNLDVSGGISDITDDPDSPDSNWFTTTGKDGALRVSFPTPTGNPTTGADVQEFRVLLRKDASGGGTPTYVAELRETGGGSALETLASGASVTSTTGQVESLTWDASNLGTADGSAVELVLTFTHDGGGPNERNVEVGAVSWNVDYTAGATPQSCDASTSNVATLTKQVITAKAASVSASAGLTKAVDLTARAAMVSASATLTKSVTLGAFSATVAAVANLASSRIFLQSCDAVVSAVAELVRKTLLARGAVTSNTAALTRQAAIERGVVASNVGGLVRDVALTRGAVVAATGALTRRTLLSKSVQTSNSAGLSATLVFLQACATVTSNVAGLLTATTFHQLCAATVSGTAQITKDISVGLSVMASAVAGLVTDYSGDGSGSGGGRQRYGRGRGRGVIP